MNITGDELKRFLREKSYSSISRISWSEWEVQRLNAGVRFYKRHFPSGFSKACYEDIRFEFYGAISFDQFNDKIKALKKIQRRWIRPVNQLEFLGDVYMKYPVEYIVLDTIKKIYKERYGVYLRDSDNVLEKMTEKFISYHSRNSLLLHIAYMIPLKNGLYLFEKILLQSSLSPVETQNSCPI